MEGPSCQRIAAIITCIMTFLVSVTHSTVLQTLLSSATHLELYDDTYYVASTNNIYKLDAQLNIIEQIVIGPKNGADNYIRIFKINPDPSHPVLFWCGTLDDGLCHVNSLTNLHAGDFFRADYYKNSLQDRMEKNLNNIPEATMKVLDYGVFGYLGSETSNAALFVDISSHSDLRRMNGRDYILYLSSTQPTELRLHHIVPDLAFYSLLNITTDYFIKPTFINPGRQKYSWLISHQAMATRHPIIHIAMAQLGGYIYSVSVQRRDVVFFGELYGFHTRVSRVNATDPIFKTYIEMPIDCHVSDDVYNLAIDAELASLNGEPTLFLLQGKSGGSLYPENAKSAICALPISDLNSRLDEATRQCHGGNGSLAEWYYGSNKKCELQVSVFNLYTSQTHGCPI